MLTPPSLLDSLAHKVGQHRALILPSKRLIERLLHIGRNAKVDGSHRDTLIVEIFNNSMAVIGQAVKLGNTSGFVSNIYCLSPSTTLTTTM
jgi:hypothetical protein